MGSPVTCRGLIDHLDGHMATPIYDTSSCSFGVIVRQGRKKEGNELVQADVQVCCTARSMLDHGGCWFQGAAQI